MKYLRLYNFIADAIRILAIQEEEVYNVNSSKRGHMLRTNGALSPF